MFIFLTNPNLHPEEAAFAAVFYVDGKPQWVAPAAVVWGEASQRAVYGPVTR
jgi:hypothetical protein